VVQQHEFTPSSPLSSQSYSPRKDDASDDSEVPLPGGGTDSESGGEDCGSSDEDFESGAIFKKLEKERQRASHERKYLVETLKSKSRVGSIFFDTVKRVVAAVQRTEGVYDFLIEWDFCVKDKLKPTTSIVSGSHFVICKPLLYRRHLE